MKVLLVNPPDVDSSLFDWATAKRGRANNYPAYGLGVLATHLKDNGFEPRILNLNHELLKKVYLSEKPIDYDATWKEMLKNEITSFIPGVVGVTCLFSVTHNSLVAVCHELKRLTTVPLCIGGVHVTHDVDKVMSETGADYAFLNESEQAFIDFLKEGKLTQVVTKEGKYLEKNMPRNLDVIPPFEDMDVENHSLFGTLGSWYGFR